MTNPRRERGGEAYPTNNKPPPEPPKAACKKPAHPFCCGGSLVTRPIKQVPCECKPGPCGWKHSAFAETEDDIAAVFL